MLRWTINFYQGQFHKLFGHPMDAVTPVEGASPGIRVVEFTCKECGRSFKKQLCATCGR